MSGTTREAVQKFKDRRRQKAEKQISRPKSSRKPKRKRYKIQCRAAQPTFSKRLGDWWTCGRYTTEKHMHEAYRQYTSRGSVYLFLKCDFRCVYPDGSIVDPDENEKVK